MPQCTGCRREFGTSRALADHCRDKPGHQYMCNPCNRTFVNPDALRQHLQSPRHQNSSSNNNNKPEAKPTKEKTIDEPGTSNPKGSTLEEQKGPANDPEKEKYHVSDDAIQSLLAILARHLQDISPSTESGSTTDEDVDVDDGEDDDDDEDDEDDDDEDEDVVCLTCNKKFINKESLNQHLGASPKHNWCFICSRDFRDSNALEQHSSSRTHYVPSLPCPLCSDLFKIPSSIAHHIESGACGGISRHQVTAAVHSLEILPAISISPGAVDPPSPARTTFVGFAATEEAFNGSAYECYLCGADTTFRTLSALNAHLGSPAHDADQFRCTKCAVRFTLVSGLVQHIESGVCGVAKFERVLEYAASLADMFSRLLKQARQRKGDSANQEEENSPPPPSSPL